MPQSMTLELWRSFFPLSWSAILCWVVFEWLMFISWFHNCFRRSSSVSFKLYRYMNNIPFARLRCWVRSIYPQSYGICFRKGKSVSFLYGTWHEITDMHVLKFSLFINRAKVKASAHSIMRVIRCVTSVLNNITYVQTNHKLTLFNIAISTTMFSAFVWIVTLMPHQQPTSKSMQLHNIPVTAFSYIDLRIGFPWNEAPVGVPWSITRN